MENKPKNREWVKTAAIIFLADLILAMIKVCRGEKVNDALSEFDYETSRILARSMAFVSESSTEKQNVIAF